MSYPMPGDELGPCPCGHRKAMCHRENAARYCPYPPSWVEAERDRVRESGQRVLDAYEDWRREPKGWEPLVGALRELKATLGPGERERT